LEDGNKRIGSGHEPSGGGVRRSVDQLAVKSPCPIASIATHLGRRDPRGSGETALLRGFADEVGQLPIGIEVVDLEGRWEVAPLTRPPARGWNGIEVSRPPAEQQLGGCGSAEPAMRAKPHVVIEHDAESALEVVLQEGRAFTEAAEALERAEDALDHGDGSGAADGSEAVSGAVALERSLEGQRCELDALVGDGVTGRTEVAGGGREELSEIAPGGIEDEGARARRRPRPGRA
jgi:hypothetical protein